MVYEPGVLTGLYGAKASVMCHCRRSTVSEWLSRTCSGGGASVVARRTGRLTGGWPTGGGKAWGNTSVVAGEGATRGPRLGGPRYETEPVSRLPVEFSIFPAVVLSPNVERFKIIFADLRKAGETLDNVLDSSSSLPVLACRPTNNT
ncbi:hypothetical protein V1477_019097 [Vespula maculifrons]|uniref:Uncharacterized protein n=2 Tax=Vespula TaxID=7451 RepID=A0A834J1A4_VESVU|nr:hypothetical protein HZH66_014374 [Vespula vulgaris]